MENQTFHIKSTENRKRFINIQLVKSVQGNIEIGLHKTGGH
jgi:hypothetical protein